MEIPTPKAKPRKSLFVEEALHAKLRLRAARERVSIKKLVERYISEGLAARS